MKCLIFNIVRKPRLSAMPGRSLGAYKIAHLLRSQGWDAEIIDFVGFWKLEELKSLVLSRRTTDLKFFGFSALFDSVDDITLEFRKWLKETFPDTPIISGSQYHVNYNKDYIDYFISGFGEVAVLELLKYLFSNGKSPIFSLQSNDKRKIIQANTFYPALTEDLSVRYEKRDFIQPGEWLMMEFSRGCKFSCSFCDFPFLGVKGDPSRSKESFEEEVKNNYYNFGVQNYIVADSTFNDSTEKIAKFADVVQALDFEPFFSAYIRADLLVARPRDREELARMNLLAHVYGIDSFNPETGKSIGKGMDSEKLKQGLLDIKKYFQSIKNKRYLGSISMIAGLPYETIESLQASLDWLEKNWLPHPVHMEPYALLVSDIKQSKISSDYSKFSYQSMEKDLDESTLLKIKDFLRDDGDLLIWKNENMNIIQAFEITRNFKSRTLLNSHIGSFELSNIMFNKCSLDERLKLTHGGMTINEDQVEQEFIRNYINKKLSI